MGHELKQVGGKNKQKKPPRNVRRPNSLMRSMKKMRTDKLNSYNYDNNTVYIARLVKKDKYDNDAK